MSWLLSRYKIFPSALKVLNLKYVQSFNLAKYCKEVSQDSDKSTTMSKAATTTEVTDEEENLSLDYWDKRWITGESGWHLRETSQHLLDNAHILLPRPEKYRVLVPLCGKSLDLLWLYKEGHRVVGIEGVERVVQEFGEEHNIAFQVVTIKWGKIYRTKDQRLQIYVCDLFSVLPHEIGRFDAVFDRGSFVAINASDRPRYANMMRLMLRPLFRYLMVVVVYDPSEQFTGPPCSVPTPVVHKLFGEFAQWKLMNTVDRSEEKKTKEEYKIEGKFVENVLLLSTKSVKR